MSGQKRREGMLYDEDPMCKKVVVCGAVVLAGGK